MADFYMSNVTGLLDVEAFVKSLTVNKQKQIQNLAQNRAILQAKSTSINNLISALKDLQGTNESITPDSLFKGKQASVSDTSILSAKVSENAPNVSLKVKPTQLAQTEMRVTTGGVANPSDNLSASTFTLRYWTSDTASIETTINFSGGTLNDLVDAINSAQNKVAASVYYDGTNYKLMLAEKNVGDSSRETSTGAVIEISSGSLPSPLGSPDTVLQEAKNAVLKVGSDSNQITSPTNTFENVLTGLTVTAKKTSDNFIDITISDSYDKARQSISGLLEKINGVLEIVNQMTSKGALFQGNSSITQIKTNLFSLTKPLQELGLINITDEGKYSLNGTAFNDLVNNGKISNIQSALSDTKSRLGSYLEGALKSFQVYKTTQDNQIQMLDKKAEALQVALTKEQEKIRVKFSQIEALMYQNEQLKSRLENFVVSLSEANKK
jgi:flagellar hook-associated protein 2